MILPVKTAQGGYDITIERGALKRAGELFKLGRKVLIVTDDNVPKEYSECVASQCADAHIVTIAHGEMSKNESTFMTLLHALVEKGFTRTDCVVAVGGGVVGDLSGFAAACYMRGIDFYNIPTTVLSQVDSSVGGKTAIDFGGYKNIIGAFWQPKGVIVDPDTLKTLPARHIANGLAEALKMSMTSDPELFDVFENGSIDENIDRIIEGALRIKRYVVEEDEREAGLRKILNFGHTLAHALESADGMENYLHGECVAAGMVPMCSDDVRERLIPILEKMHLPVSVPLDPEKVTEAVRHDKKASGDKITVIYVPEIGKFEMKTLTISEFTEQLRKAISK